MTSNPVFPNLAIKFNQLIIVVAMLFAGTTAFAQEQVSADSATIFLNDSDTLFTKVDKKPQFPSGLKAWQKFINKTMRYPQEAQDNEIMGVTRISFIVDVDSTVSDIRALEGHPVLAEESIRVIKLSGKWEPAVYQGQKIKSYQVQPLVYRLETSGEPRRRRKR